MKLNEINIRDPFILPFDGKYYMYGSRVSHPNEDSPWGTQTGFDVYVSEDLENWSSPKSVFEKIDSFWGENCFWAPEVHIYNGKFYMLATFKAANKCRATHILVSDTPDGTFRPLSDHPVTPPQWECLDGTLYIDKHGIPHLVFCHEWLQIDDGTVCEVALSSDLSEPISQPRVLFRASDYPGVRSVSKKKNAYVTDGPFMYRTQAGKLFCLWSTASHTGYCELIAESDNGDIDGNWAVSPVPLSAQDGGHGMLFQAYTGKTLFVMHQPNTTLLERPVIMELVDENNCLTLSNII